MPAGSTALYLLLAAVCVAANGFFVAAEFALAKVRPSSLEALARNGDVAAGRALALTRRLDPFLTATQFGITLASLGLGWLGEPALSRLLDPLIELIGVPERMLAGVSLVVAFSVISVLHIVVGELVPKSMAIQRPERVARWCAVPLRMFYIATFPLLFVLNSLSNACLRLLRLPPAGHGDGIFSADEIRLLIQASFQGTEEQERKRELLERVLRGTDRTVRAVMVPRVDMVTVPIDRDIEGCLKLVRKHGYSRYPLTEGDDPDKVVGYVYVKDVLMAETAATHGVRSMQREILFVPETKTVGEILEEFQRTHIPIAIVVDEYGGTSGLVSLEDVVEEIVGELQDEHDVETPRVHARSDGTLILDGAVPVDELDLEGLELGAVDEADTIGGYLVARLGRLARPGDRVRVGAYDAVVSDVRRRRVARVVLTPRQATVPPPATVDPED